MGYALMAYNSGPRRGSAGPRAGVSGPRVNVAAPKASTMPAFNSKVADPLAGVKPKDTVEETAKAELAALSSAYKAEEQKQRSRTERNDDGEFWCTLVFESQAQKDEFLKAVGWYAHGDKYLDGRWVAAKMGVNLTHTDWKPQRPKPDPTLKGMVGAK